MGGAHHHHHGPDAGSERWHELTSESARHTLIGIVVAVAVATFVGLVIWLLRGDVNVEDRDLVFNDQANATVTAAVGRRSCSPDATTDGKAAMESFFALPQRNV